MKEPVLVFFQSVNMGDVRKAHARSHDTPSGGGARDLRMPKAFVNILNEMFPKQASKPGVRTGTLHWVHSGTEESVVAELHTKPTRERQTEIWIGRIPRVRPWKLDEKAAAKANAEGRHLFYVLAMDGEGRVWADVLDEDHFPLQDPNVVAYIKKRIEATPKHKSIRGSIDFRTGKRYPP